MAVAMRLVFLALLLACGLLLILALSLVGVFRLGLILGLLVGLAVRLVVTRPAPCFEALARHVDGDRHQLPGAPAQIAAGTKNGAVRQRDLDHDVRAVFDEIGERVIAACDLEAAVGRGHCLADQFIYVVIAIVRAHVGTRDWLPRRLLPHTSSDGSVHGRPVEFRCQRGTVTKRE
jgi:hypothetical protein